MTASFGVAGLLPCAKVFFCGETEADTSFPETVLPEPLRVQNNNDATAALVVKHGIFANENVAKIAIPKCNVTYIDGNEMKSAMNDFLNALSTINIQSIGGKLPTDKFYYINE